MDFFIVTEPKWIEQLPADVKKRLGRPAAAIVSTDLTWITCVPYPMRVPQSARRMQPASINDSSGSLRSKGLRP
jgi:hypothetical protein